MTRWADRAQYVSEAATSTRPVVTLIGATADPLGEIASLTAMYEGRVVRSLSDLTDEDRRRAFADMLKTKLDGSLEAVQFHFLIENVTRAWTHQAVRNRFAFFAQESLRFAVVEDWADRVAMPPTIAPGTEAEARWDAAVEMVAKVYQGLVNSGVPAEDARGLLPHSITTRLHCVMSLRTLLQEAGKRLCTQAQFEWRVVMAGMVRAIRSWHAAVKPDMSTPGKFAETDHWQFQLIAEMLRPVCYQEGHCGFMASMDRGCSIRERVDANAKIGRPSSEWDKPKMCHEPPLTARCDFPEVEIDAINPLEWAADPSAARHDGGGFVGK